MSEDKNNIDEGLDFVRSIIAQDVRSNKHGGQVVTRFPPEPNGYLHIGHAKSICLNFGSAAEHNGRCHLRFDDSNPCTEETEFVESIKHDVRWLGFDWGEHEYFASEYFEQMYQWAEQLIKEGKAYVCSLSGDEVRELRGTPTEAGKNSPDRDRPAEESLDLFRRMRAGEFPDGAYTLRAKIDMASGNLNMRDPVLYRIRHEHHHRTGDQWCIYPMYDYCHCTSDSVEHITHSICTLEFEDHRPLYDWILDELRADPHPQQIEFARLNISHTVLSKRKLLQLVNEKHVNGWDDPRMPTLAGMRRRGYTPAAIRDFCERIGVAKADNLVEKALLEFCLRNDLNRIAERRMAVLRPLKLVITNYPEGQVEELEAENNPEDSTAGKRTVPFSRELWIEQEDFVENPPKKWFRLAPGAEVRLKHAYYVTCDEVRKDADGSPSEIRCHYDPKTKGGWSDDGRKVKGTLHWVSAKHAIEAEVRLYSELFTVENPSVVEQGQSFLDYLNPKSLEVIQNAKIEPALAKPESDTHYQFLRLGYFYRDPDSEKSGKPTFNLTVNLRDTWGKISKNEK